MGREVTLITVPTIMFPSVGRKMRLFQVRVRPNERTVALLYDRFLRPLPNP